MYALPDISYLAEWRKGRALAFLNSIPSKKVEHFPRSGNEGLYGFTFRHDGKVHIREDLIDYQKTKTDIHECIHTPDERETRYLVDEIMKVIFPEEEKYIKKKK